MQLEEICFTDHRDFDYPIDSFDLDIETYYQTIMALKKEYQDKIKIKWGIEIGLDLNYFQEKQLTFLVVQQLYYSVYVQNIFRLHLLHGYQVFWPVHLPDLSSFLLQVFLLSWRPCLHIHRLHFQIRKISGTAFQCANRNIHRTE